MKKTLAQLTLLALAWSLNAHAQPLPATYRFVSGNPAGGTNDIITRIVASKVAADLKATTVVENVAGGSGLIAQAKLVTSPADGATLMVAGANQVLLDVVNGTDKMRELAGLTGVAGIPLVLVGRRTLEPRSVDELVAFMRKSENRLTVGGGGSGTMPHMATALLQQRAGVTLSYVPYRGAPNMLPDLMGGHIDLAVLVLPAALSSIRDGSVRAYGLFSGERVTVAPDIPLLSESQALNAINPLESWLAVYASARTPQPLREKLGASLSGILQTPEVRAAIAKVGATPLAMDASAVSRKMEADAHLYRKLIKSNNLKFER
ncbi:tripartite tricarboxylate transporter substrate binding protein [Ramlibacter sp. WS9]|uniref:tripartite tricarboxylate transporter substrate binding protein n=1 Tax=Ramlibacter sp. WS9 TaxID=1882741 RepID=UPI00130510E4|nr:tripartite tricarboxylate transporter substrate binding protein [Ramlibacter sp. WS9]HSV36709.1 tripartite tricarboxylate transporter substrate binding protein [Ramlibacter sp.]